MRAGCQEGDSRLFPGPEGLASESSPGLLSMGKNAPARYIIGCNGPVFGFSMSGSGPSWSPDGELGNDGRCRLQPDECSGSGVAVDMVLYAGTPLRALYCLLIDAHKMPADGIVTILFSVVSDDLVSVSVGVIEHVAPGLVQRIFVACGYEPSA